MLMNTFIGCFSQLDILSAGLTNNQINIIILQGQHNE